MATPGLAVDKSWNGGNGSWGDPANWIPFGVPTNVDEIRIGNLPGVENSTVMMAPPGTGYGLLEVSDGMTLDMNGGELVSFDEATISGQNSRLIVRPAVGGNDHDFQGELYMSNGTHMELHDGVAVRLFGDCFSNATVTGNGSIVIASEIPFTSGGILQPAANGGLVVQQGTSGDGSIDLDALGSGRMYLDTSFSELEIIAESLYDPFSGELKMGPGSQLTMSLDQEWTIDNQAEVEIQGTNNPAAASLIAGSPLTFDGLLDVNSFEAHLRVLADTTFEDNAVVIIGFTDWVEMDGATTIAGGQFTLSSGGILDFDGPTTVQGGSFFTINTDTADGVVDFNGATTWFGGCGIDGIARQMGNAFVSGPSVINAEVFDMDGDGDTLWTIWNDLEINADAVQSDGTALFTGTATIANGSSGRLAMNLGPENPMFGMAGEMNLVGHPAVFSTRYAGAGLDLLGELNISGHVAMDGYLRALDGTLDFGGASAVLRLDDNGVINSSCAVSGAGDLLNGVDSNLHLADAYFGNVGLVNRGMLRIAPSANVGGFVNEASGVWEVVLGGYDEGTDFDQLLVSGNAVIDGSIVVGFEDGEEAFRPELGDEFTILSATESVSGSFIADPLTLADGFRYEWTVEYGDDAVVLVLAQVVDLSVCAVAAESADCADVNLDNIRDDNCVWWECADLMCVDTPLQQFADMGGAFGECAPDNFANVHDKNHALMCFAGTNSCDSINIDAGGPFGDCSPDGFCNVHDANHAMAAFAGTTTCSCPAGPMPEFEPAVWGQATLRLEPRTKSVNRDGTIDIDVFIGGPVDALRSYQLELKVTGGRLGGLDLVSIRIDERWDGAFAGRFDAFEAFNVQTGQMLAGLDADQGCSHKNGAYLATFTYAATQDCGGKFVIDIASGDNGQTVLIAPQNRQITVGQTQPAVVEMQRKR
jgi:hypothetical protein